jgi:hypothetical protein
MIKAETELNLSYSEIFSRWLAQGNTNLGERLSTVDRVIRITCFGRKVNNILNIKGADLN